MDGILYSFRRCPYAMRARMALAEARIDVEIREVVLRDKPADMLAIAPKATVPVLQLPDGRVIDESLDIMDWALRVRDPEDWLRHRDDATRCELLATHDGAFKRDLDRTKYPDRYPRAETEGSRERAHRFLRMLDARCSDGYLDGRTLGFFDVAMFPFVRQFAAIDPPAFAAEDWPRLAQWHRRIAADPRFTQVMAKLAPWRPGDPPIRLLDLLG